MAADVTYNSEVIVVGTELSPRVTNTAVDIADVIGAAAAAVISGVEDTEEEPASRRSSSSDTVEDGSRPHAVHSSDWPVMRQHPIKPVEEQTSQVKDARAQRSFLSWEVRTWRRWREGGCGGIFVGFR